MPCRSESLNSIAGIKTTVGVSAVFLVFALAGCGDSGAKLKPTVIAKPAESASGGGTTANGEAPVKPADGGATPAASTGGFGTFAGRVVFDGEAPKPAELVRQGDASAKDAAVCAAMAVPNESLVVSEDGGIANVFLFLGKMPAGGKNPPAPTEPVVFDQKGCRFIPHALAVRVGEPVQILNDDAVSHNANIKPANGKNSAAALNRIFTPKDRTGVTIKYAAAERVPVFVKCDIHPWMAGYQMPVDHPYFAVTDASGKFEIKDLPGGTHDFLVWHEKKGFLNRSLKVTIKDGETTSQELKFGASSFAGTRNGPPSKVLVVNLTRD